MKKRIVFRSLLGVPLGLALGYLITIVTSFIWGDGYYAPCVPELVEMTESEINAVMLQALLCGIVGAGFSAASVIWEIEDWGIVKQTGIYFLAASVIMLPIAYVMHWMEHSLSGVLIYFGIFFFIFVVMWVVMYLIARHNVKKMNETLYRKRGMKADRTES